MYHPYIVNLMLRLVICFPFVDLLFLTLFDKNSGKFMNIYGERGSPS